MEEDPVNGNCIKFFQAEVTANEATNMCNEMGGHLVHIKDQAYNDWVRPFYKNFYFRPS